MLFIAFSVLVYTFYRIFDCSFNKTRNTDFCSNFNFCRCYLSILIMFLDFSSLLYLVVYAFIWRIIIQAIKRILAGVKSMIANFYAFFLVFLSLFVLKATTSHIFIKSFVCFNTLYHINDLSFLYFFASLSQYGREQCPDSAKSKNPLLVALFQRLHDIHRASGCMMLLLIPTLDIRHPRFLSVHQIAKSVLCLQCSYSQTTARNLYCSDGIQPQYNSVLHTNFQAHLPAH